MVQTPAEVMQGAEPLPVFGVSAAGKNEVTEERGSCLSLAQCLRDKTSGRREVSGKAIAKHPNKAQTSQASPAFCSLLPLLPSLENTHLCVCAKFVTVNTDAMAYFLNISLQLN